MKHWDINKKALEESERTYVQGSQRNAYKYGFSDGARWMEQFIKANNWIKIAEDGSNLPDGICFVNVKGVGVVQGAFYNKLCPYFKAIERRNEDSPREYPLTEVTHYQIITFPDLPKI